jgi:hypothetical protein
MKYLPPSEWSAAQLLERLSGTTVGSERLREVVAEYAPIFEEISRLQELDLRDVHPAVLYEPTAPYRRTP